MLFVFGGMTVNVKAAVTKNADDVKALEKIINEKRKSGEERFLPILTIKSNTGGIL